MDKLPYAIGRRKESVARVFVKQGNAEILVNGKDYKEYFPLLHLQYQVALPFSVIKDAADKYCFFATVKGGGKTGQAEAVKLGISRLLVALNSECKPLLKEHSLLTRDSREVERKKPGRKKARKRFQFVKR